MSEDSYKEDHLSHSTSEEPESDEDSYIPFVPEDLQRYEYSDAIWDPYAQRTTQIIFEYQSGRRIPRLREPRSLYGVSSTSSLHMARWPYECEVIPDRVWHIEWNPPMPEPVYRPTGMEKEPPYVDPSRGRVVYLVNEGIKASYFICSRIGGNRHLRQVSTELPQEVYNNTLSFESRFESGNLQKVIQVGEFDYQLMLRTDLYTDRHTQWFYFRVQNTKAGIPYRFTIINFTKPTSLYNLGMRPLMYSEREAAAHQVGWHRVGDEIRYYRNNLEQDRLQYYSLSWMFKFQHHQDTCYFAHCYPYTYSNLQDYLVGIAKDPERSKFCKIRVLCHSLARNMVYVLTITNPSTSTEEIKRKRAVILTARVHPGETNSSWMMKGFLDYILSSKKDARLLRDTFIFKVVPMLNPDGVIVGNYRCSLAGRDLNRNYKSILKDSFPSVWCTRNMIKRVMEEREVLLYCDLHGHSRKQNVFMYGCGVSGRAESTCLRERIFPLMLHKNCPDKFSFSGCKFKVQKSKEGTGRVVMWRMGISNSYTMEATFCGSSMGRRRGTHFSTKDLESMGYHFCDALLDYCDPDQSKYYNCLKELEKQQTNGCVEKAWSDSDTSHVKCVWDMESSTEGSDSSDSNGLPAHLLDTASKGKCRKKRLKKKKERNSSLIHLGLTNEEASGRTSEEKPPGDTFQHNLGSKNKSLPSQVHERHREKFAELQRVPMNPISSLHGRSYLNDLSSKKVSVVYLFFNSHGDVITSKSHSSLQKEGLQQVNHGLKDFSWNSSHSPVRNLPSRRLLIPSTASHSTAMFHSYCIGAKGVAEAVPTACLSETECDPIEEVEGQSCKRVEKPTPSALRSTGKDSSAARIPLLRGSHLRKDPVPPHLCEQMIHNLHPPSRTHGSAPLYLALTEKQQKSTNEVSENSRKQRPAYTPDRGHHYSKNNEPKQLNSSVHLKNTSERTEILDKLELSLPAVPGASARIRQEPEPRPKAFGQNQKVQTTLPNMVHVIAKTAGCSQQGHLPHRDFRGWSHQHFSTNLLLCEQQEALRADALCPGGTGDVSKSNNAETIIPVTKYTKLPTGTWNSILQSQEARATSGNDPTGNPAACFNHPSSIQRATDTAGESCQHDSQEKVFLNPS